MAAEAAGRAHPDMAGRAPGSKAEKLKASRRFGRVPDPRRHSGGRGGRGQGSAGDADRSWWDRAREWRKEAMWCMSDASAKARGRRGIGCRRLPRASLVRYRRRVSSSCSGARRRPRPPFVSRGREAAGCFANDDMAAEESLGTMLTRDLSSRAGSQSWPLHGPASSRASLRLAPWQCRTRDRGIGRPECICCDCLQTEHRHSSETASFNCSSRQPGPASRSTPRGLQTGQHADCLERR